MSNYAFKTAVPWYTMVIKEQGGHYRDPVKENRALNNEKYLIDLRNDYAFKLLVGSKGNERILIEFLNVILKLPVENQIREVTLENTEILKENAEDKKSILDILVRTQDGDYINIEIQMRNEYDMPVRSLYYGAKLISKEMLEGNPYCDLKKTVMINIVNFHQFSDTEAYHSRFELYDLKSKVALTDQLQIHFVELTKFLERRRMKQLHPHEDRLARWLLLLEASKDRTIRTELEEIAMQQDPVLAEALDKWGEMSQDPSVRMAYYLREKQLTDEAARISTAERRGKASTIPGMLKAGLSITQISEITGITVGEVEERIQKNKY